MKTAAYVLLLLVVLALSVPGFAQAPDVGRNKALVRRYIGQVLNGHRLEMLDQLVSPNYKRYLSPVAAPLNPEGQKQRLAGFFAAFPDLRCTIDDLIAEGDRVAYRLTCPVTHQGAFLGIAPTGKQVVAQAFELARVENGKLVEHWGGPDTFNLLQQLGATVR